MSAHIHTAPSGGGKVEETAEVATNGDVAAPSSSTRLPTMFISHGGGPSFFLRGRDVGGMADIGPGSKLERSLKSIGKGLNPSAILIITAHWETDKKVTVSSGDYRKLYFDYYGFPDYTYKLKWPAKGSPSLTKRVQSLLSAAGIDNGADTERGFDHGVFIPMLLAYPDASVPTVAMSLRRDLDPSFHIRLGKALQPLRDEGVLIIGSGFSYHGFGARASRADKLAGASAFDDWLHSNIANPAVSAAARNEALVRWAEAPGARLTHPREEHLLPLHVVSGAAGEDAGKRFYNEAHMGGFPVSMFRFG